jgi:hypothetical protein
MTAQKAKKRDCFGNKEDDLAVTNKGSPRGTFCLVTARRFLSCHCEERSDEAVSYFHSVSASSFPYHCAPFLRHCVPFLRYCKLLFLSPYICEFPSLPPRVLSPVTASFLSLSPRVLSLSLQVPFPVTASSFPCHCERSEAVSYPHRVGKETASETTRRPRRDTKRGHCERSEAVSYSHGVGEETASETILRPHSDTPHRSFRAAKRRGISEERLLRRRNYELAVTE